MVRQHALPGKVDVGPLWTSWGKTPRGNHVERRQQCEAGQIARRVPYRSPTINRVTESRHIYYPMDNRLPSILHAFRIPSLESFRYSARDYLPTVPLSGGLEAWSPGCSHGDGHGLGSLRAFDPDRDPLYVTPSKWNDMLQEPVGKPALPASGQRRATHFVLPICCSRASLPSILSTWLVEGKANEKQYEEDVRKLVEDVKHLRNILNLSSPSASAIRMRWTPTSKVLHAAADHLTTVYDTMLVRQRRAFDRLRAWIYRFLYPTIAFFRRARHLRVPRDRYITNPSYPLFFKKRAERRGLASLSPFLYFFVASHTTL
ncbi:hypothetical protein F5Y18DRAFT_432054 [Xylariaceae sp. FL1019]|nr:hypothetical protein F5Y18DRAFT_432054 [Xylariaceae sp. FL1019]